MELHSVFCFQDKILISQNLDLLNIPAALALKEGLGLIN